MPILPAMLVNPINVPITNTIVYTVPANTQVQVKKLTVSNPTAGACKFTLWMIPPAAAVNDTTVLVKQKVVATLTTYEAYPAEGHVLPSLSTIVVVADVVGLVLQVSGITIA